MALAVSKAMDASMLRRFTVVCGRQTRQRWASGVVLSDRRLQEFMQAEITHFAQSTVGPVKLSQIVKASTPPQVADLVYSQLPVHFATRIKHIEKVPYWDSADELAMVHKILTVSFQKLRTVEEADDIEALTEVVSDIRARHKTVVPLLSHAIAQMVERGVLDHSEADDWLDDFLRARISTEMLTGHYMALQYPRGGETVGLVDSRCYPGQICQEAADNVHRKMGEYSTVPINVVSHNCSASNETIEFSFLPLYFRYLMEELLKNSVQAVFKNRSPEAPRGDETVHVNVAADPRQVMIKISDKGGGIPSHVQRKVFSYWWSSREDRTRSRSSSIDLDAPADPNAASIGDPLAGVSMKSRLGMGLPMCRLLTEYLGGNLTLLSIPRVGVDTYLVLRRIDAQSVSSMSSVSSLSSVGNKI